MANLFNRKTLKTFFERKKIPTAEQFADMIDSIPNIIDDGAVVFGNEGFSVFTKDRNKRDGDVLEICQNQADGSKKIQWKFNMNVDGDLSITDKQKKNLITFSNSGEGEILVNTDIKIKGNIIFDNAGREFTGKYYQPIEYYYVYEIAKGEEKDVFYFSENWNKDELFEVKIISDLYCRVYVFRYNPTKNKVVLYNIYTPSDSECSVRADEKLKKLFIKNTTGNDAKYIVQINRITCGINNAPIKL